MKQVFFFACSALLIFMTACTDPISVGSDLLDGDRAALGQTTELPFTTTVVREDSIVTFDASANALLSSFTFGQLTNEVFGELKHSAYIIPSLPRSTSTGLVTPPAFALNDETSVDSIVLFLPIDTSAGLYGNGSTFPVRMTQLAGPLDQNQDFNTEVDLMINPLDDLQREDAFSAALEATLLYDTIISNGDSVLFPHVRIAFDQQFVERMNMADESVFESDTTFWEYFPGLYLEPTDDSGSLITLQPQPTAGQSPFAGIFYFYKDTVDQSPTFYRAPLSLWLPRYEQDYTGTLFADKLAAGEDNESFVVAGQAGVMTAITFTDLSSIEDVVINEALLTFYREDAEGLDYDLFEVPSLLALYYLNDEGNLEPIEDRQRLGNPFSSPAILQFLGGDPLEDDDENIFYQPRFSVHLQRMVDGDVPTTIYLRVAPVDSDPARVLLSGPEADVRPATIRVTFTELD